MKTKGTVTEITTAGDLITDISAEHVGQHPRDVQARVIVDQEHETIGIYDSAADQPAMTLLAIQAGTEPLRVHLVGDSAAMMLGIKVGAPVRVES